MERTHVNPTIHHRRSIRLKSYDYAQAGAYFVTICAYQRACLFGEIMGEAVDLSTTGSVVVGCWEEIPQHFPGIELDAFVVMPNHLHAIIVIDDHGMASQPPVHEALLRPSGPRPRSLGSIIGQFKAASSKRINVLRATNIPPVWQRNYFERIIRNDDELRRVREYMANNPLRWLDDDEHPSKIGTAL